MECANFALDFKEGKPAHWISILGASGTGKTHCGRKLWKALESKFNWQGTQHLQHEIYWPRFVFELRSGNSYDKLRAIMDWPALFLDDVGAERDTTGFAAEQLNTLLGCRVGKWTIITSNLTIEQIGNVEPRIADRIIRHPNQFIEVNTESWALKQLRTRV